MDSQRIAVVCTIYVTGRDQFCNASAQISAVNPPHALSKCLFWQQIH